MEWLKNNAFAIYLGFSLSIVGIHVKDFAFWIVMVPLFALIAWRDKKRNWISVDDWLPEDEKNVLVIHNGELSIFNYGVVNVNGDNMMAWMNCYGDINGEPEWDDDYSPTCWMPLPEQLKEKSNVND